MTKLSFESKTAIPQPHDCDDFIVNMAELAEKQPEMIVALAAHGLKQKMGDKSAMSKIDKAQHVKDGTLEDTVANNSQSVWDDLMAGNFASRAGGSRLSPLEVSARHIWQQNMVAAGVFTKADAASFAPRWKALVAERNAAKVDATGEGDADEMTAKAIDWVYNEARKALDAATKTAGKDFTL